MEILRKLRNNGRTKERGLWEKIKLKVNWVILLTMIKVNIQYTKELYIPPHKRL